MGRTTFEPALTNDRWPWPDLDVFVLGSQRPAGTPDHVVSDSDPARLLGMRLTPSFSPDTGLTFERERALAGGSVEIVYAVSGSPSGLPGRDAGWSPASQRRS